MDNESNERCHNPDIVEAERLNEMEENKVKGGDLMNDVFLEPINDYTFGRGVQKNPNGKYRWWFCAEENRISPDFELSKMGVVEELVPDDAMRRLWNQGLKAWYNVKNNYPNAAREMAAWERKNI